MSIAFRCPCGQKLRAKPEMAGRQTRCPKCSAVVDIPTQQQSAPQIDTGQPAQHKAASAPQINTGQPAPSHSTPVPTPQPAATPQPAVTPQPVETPQPVATPQPTPVPVQPVQQFVEMIVPCVCGASFQVSSQFAGQQTNCPTCGNPCVIPQQGAQQGAQQPVVTPVQQPIVSSGIPQTNPYESPSASIGPAPKPISLEREFSKVKIGALIAAIALCVFAGAILMNYLGQGLTQISVLIGAASVSRPPERPSSTDFSTRESYNAEMRKYREKLEKWQKKQPSPEKLRKRAKMIRNLTKVADVFYKIGHVVLVISIIGCIVGFVFSFLIPTRKALMGVAIAMTAAGALAAIFYLIFQMIPILDDDMFVDYRGHTTYIFMWPAEADFADAFIAGLIDTLLFSPLILSGVFLLLAGKSLNRKDIASSGMLSLWLVGGFLVFLAILFVMALIDFKLKQPALVPMILVWFFQWAANIALGVGLFFLIRGFFKLKSVNLSGGNQRKGYGGTASFR